MAAWDSEVGGEPITRKVCDDQTILYRRLSGEVVALRDTCLTDYYRYLWGLQKEVTFSADIMDWLWARC